MKKAICLTLSLALLMTLVSCSKTQEETSASTAATTSQTEATATEQTSDGTSATETTAEYHHEFLPHVYAKIYDDNFNEDTKKAFFSLCDALLSGGEEFYCPDSITMYNIKDTISGQCMPLADVPGISIDVGKIKYEIPKDQYMAKVEEFKSMIVSILDECIKPGYSDVDKALALYTYFETHYMYDYDALTDDSMSLSAYRLLTERKGICQEIAPLYAYLMLQAGVDCTTCGSLNNINEAHEWAFATLDGEYYHIDPTWVITDPETLKYFGMTDDKRAEEGGWDMKILNYGAANIFDDRGEFAAESTRFSGFWDSVTYEVDYDSDTVHFYKLSDASEQVLKY